MKDNFKKQLWLSFGIIFGAILVAAVAIYFISGDISAQADKIVVDKTTMNSQNGQLATLADLETDAPIAANYETAMDKLLPTEDQLFNFPQWVETFGQNYQVDAEASFVGSPNPSQGTTPGTAGFSLQAQGTSANLVAFLQAFEAASPQFLVQLSSFNLTADGSDYQIVSPGTVYFR